MIADQEKQMKIIRVFTTATRATPRDDMVIVNQEPGFFDQADEIHISVLFTWHRKRAEKLAKSWERIAPVKIGGPGYGSRGEEFVSGRYVAPGYTITSRGCPNQCWFCDVWKREGQAVRELPIVPGHNVLDDNLLACSEQHIRAVFDMLRKQHEPIQFTGGWEAARLKEWHIDLLSTIRLKQLWFAYDDDADLEPLICAGKMLQRAGFSRTKTGNISHAMRCYCLIGWPNDTMTNADKRLRTAYENGFLPMAMLYRNQNGETDYAWRRFQRAWARPAAINRICRNAVQAWH